MHEFYKYCFVGYFSLAVEALNDLPVFTLSENQVIADEDFTGTYRIPIIPEEVPEDKVSQTDSGLRNPKIPSIVGFRRNFSCP